MPVSKEFIEVHALLDGCRAAIRASSIDGVYDNAEKLNDFGHIDVPECRTIRYSGGSIDVTESYDDVMNMIFDAEL